MVRASNKYKQRLNSIKKGVIRRFRKGKPEEWRNRDFDDLSFEVHKATKVLISGATLKRIFGKNKTSESYYPQDSTLDALEQYAGPMIAQEFDTKKWLLTGTPILLVFIVFVVIFLKTYKKEEAANIQTKLKLSKIEGTTPATAFFNYQVPDSKDSIFISYDDGYPSTYLKPGSQMVSHVYNYPGLFKVALQTRTQTVSDTLKVLVPTNEWQALAYYYQQDFRSRYYPVPMSIAAESNSFHLSPKQLSGIGMDTTKIVVLRLDNFKPTQKSGDSFTLKTRLKNINYWPAIRCYSAYIFVKGENGEILFKVTNEGCSGHAEYVLSEKHALGTGTDLTALTLNIKDWNTVQITNKDKNVSVMINEEPVFQNSYSRSIGNIVGVSLQFHGSGYVDFFELYDKDLKPVFSKDF